jgi:glycosyltransferase involved in cell wall biosynthesis
MKKYFYKVSIIIRTRNEVQWISRCLNEIYNQKYKNFEVILVDHQSRDKTISLVKKNFPLVKIIKYNSKVFYPGKALNLGIKFSKGSLIAMISGHCIPKNNLWLSNLVKNFRKRNVGAVYGRQEPLDTSSPNDYRDLTYIFGLDKKIQKNDPFFHNANSMIRKDLWLKNKFHEHILHIEDRVWANEILKKKYYIVYEPSSIVFHFHGIGHHDNTTRVNLISKILKKNILKRKKKIIALIPVKKLIKVDDQYILIKTIDDLLKFKEVSKIIISTNDVNVSKIIKNKKIKVIKRDHDLNKEFLGIEYILSRIYNRHISKQYNPSHILVVEETYTKRPNNYFKNLISNIDDNFDSVIPIVKNKSHNIWRKRTDGSLEPLFKTTLPSDLVDYEIYEEIKGLGCLIKADAFATNGRECSARKFIEVNPSDLLLVNYR